MNIKKIMAGPMLLGLMLVIPSTGVAAQSYAADVISVSGNEQFSGKLYCQDGNVRMEMGPMTTITRTDKKVVWVLMDNEGMYMEQPLSPRDAVASGSAKSGEVRRTPLGVEPVDGKPAQKFEVTYDVEGNQTTVFEWLDSAWPTPVRIASVDGSWSIEYHNINLGPQDSSLFEIPAGYQKFAIPGMPAGFVMPQS
ncbi:MAG: hypothetical protein WCG06_04335 [Candidatus Omnitrophota bacterium]